MSAPLPEKPEREEIDRMRLRMMSIAYRMLGSVVDAEDAVQDAFLKLQGASDVHSPEGFLIRATTRRCIDILRHRSRSSYVGPWVPEPIDTRGQLSELSESLSQAFLLLLERLSPEERAAFLLRVVFDYEYAAIAEIVQKSEVAVRQLVSRAKRHVGLQRPRFSAEWNAADQFTETFLAACNSGDLAQVEKLLADDIEIHSDGGGKVFAARVVIQGVPRSAKYLVGIFRKLRDFRVQPAIVNGMPGAMVTLDGNLIQVMSVHIDQGIKAIYITRNPDKLTRWQSVEIV
ncbi:RNA polymerase sigma factor SigJ [Blastopirellula marina]|uniref:RNA polymerase subunit sigma-24 n=1 Tax=Blastopirellula marina TaxID=124 RepID=A0A2S8F6U7_9BACT|nr:RNA polymerase sigma factor SigJ [Blastopirellula marina]PQO27860.1 hypothetical protein C5Y98_26390 [Blastopirellula marina]PTL41595.1 RNA polymerase sigma factor SigJ [Blastopirellula marina]